MQVKDFKGKPCKWIIQGKKKERSSSLHARAREVIKAGYPFPIHEEVKLPGSRLSFDFVLPNIKLCVEVQGIQHVKQNKHFHRNKLDFIAQLKRDSQKYEWCEENGWRLVLLFDDETDEQWASKIFMTDKSE